VYLFGYQDFWNCGGNLFEVLDTLIKYSIYAIGVTKICFLISKMKSLLTDFYVPTEGAFSIIYCSLITLMSC
jgi:hypothetical protein